MPDLKSQPPPDALQLRASAALLKPPTEQAVRLAEQRAQAAASAVQAAPESAQPAAPSAPAPAAAAPAPPSSAPASPAAAAPRPPAADGTVIPTELLTAVNLGLAGLAALATLGWLYERRRRLAFTGEDDIAWAHPSDPAASARDMLDKLLPDGPSPEEAARAVYGNSKPGGKASRRAGMADLQTLARSLGRRWRRHDWDGAQSLIERHLSDFRHTSPWVFLELLLVLREAKRRADWDAASASFQRRFGQKAPAWDGQVRAGTSLADDLQLSGEICRLWPAHDSRHWLVRWMLGDAADESRTGPPLLALGVYRDMLLLDALLPEVSPSRIP